MRLEQGLAAAAAEAASKSAMPTSTEEAPTGSGHSVEGSPQTAATSQGDAPEKAKPVASLATATTAPAPAPLPARAPEELEAEAAGANAAPEASEEPAPAGEQPAPAATSATGQQAGGLMQPPATAKVDPGQVL